MKFTPRQKGRPMRAMLNLAGMIDVIFLLLIFFMVATVIKPEEARLSTMLTSRDSEASTLQPQNVDVSMSQSSPVWHVGGHRITDRQSLERVLATLPVSPGLSVSLAADVPVGAGVAVVEAARLAGFTSVRWDDIDDR
jgi:biopolymer transport protein ExbD